METGSLGIQAFGTWGLRTQNGFGAKGGDEWQPAMLESGLLGARFGHPGQLGSPGRRQATISNPGIHAIGG